MSRVPREKKTKAESNVDKVTISMPKELWDWVDAEAGTEWGARSALMQELVKEAMKTRSGGASVSAPKKSNE